MQIERREFLRLIGGLSGALVVGGVGMAGVEQMLDVPDELIDRLRTGPGIETWKSTVCGQCGGGCGVRVRLIDEIPVYIKGNPLHPVNQGGMCPLGHSALEVLFNPDRLKGPMKRVGPVGIHKWEPLDWQSALDQVTSQLSRLRLNGEARKVAFLGGDERGLMREHISRFMQAYGSPNYYQIPSTQTQVTASRLSTGRSQLPSPDLANAKLIVGFGANFIEEGPSPVYYTKLYSRLRSRTETGRARFVQIEPRMSLTAANADRWIPIIPGTYGALALAVAHILLREELYDADFVRDHTFGFESWTDAAGNSHIGYKDLVLADYYPERASEITGIPSETILELAREIGITRPSVVIGGEGVTNNVNGTYAQMAVESLNALLGNFGRDGGLIFPELPPFSALPEAPPPITEFSLERFANQLASGDPYPIEVLFLYRGNPLFQLPGTNSLGQALERVPFIVSFDSFVSETSEYADLILPDHVFLEKWDAISDVPTVAFTHVGIQQPVIEPVHDTRHTGDVLLGLANTFDDSNANASANANPFSSDSYEEMIRDRLRGVYESGEGAIASIDLTDSWLEFLQQRGWQIGRYSSFASFWKELLDKGAWWNPIRADADLASLFNTPSSRYEFYATELKQILESGPNEPQRAGQVDDAAFLPHHEPVADTDELPLFLISFETLANRGGFSSNQPMMQEMFGHQTRHYWNSWVEMNPLTAEAYGVSNGQWVWIVSGIGSLHVQAKVHPGIAPDVVAIPFGLGHTSYGRYARGHGVNPHSIMKSLYDPLNGRPALQATKVLISHNT